MRCGRGGGRAGVGSEGGWKHCKRRAVGRRGLRGWRGTHKTQQEGAAAAGQALQGREAPSANAGEGGSKKCGRDAVEGGAEAEKERIMD